MMFDIATMVIASAGGLSLALAFLDYRFSRKGKTETHKN